jgi:hypothetical protein
LLQITQSGVGNPKAPEAQHSQLSQILKMPEPRIGNLISRHI